jgi:hypothetical protein
LEKRERREKGKEEGRGEKEGRGEEGLPFSYLVTSRTLSRRGFKSFATSSLVVFGSTDWNPGVIPDI